MSSTISWANSIVEKFARSTWQSFLKFVLSHSKLLGKCFGDFGVGVVFAIANGLK